MFRLSDMRIRNFRCFEDSGIEFGTNLTVLVARNGLGKTALLDAIALALGLFVDKVAGTTQWRGFDKNDVRRLPNAEQGMIQTSVVEVDAAADINGHRISWHRSMRADSDRARTSTKDARSLMDSAADLRSRLASDGAERGDAVTLPLISYYGTGRQWGRRAAKARRSMVAPTNLRCRGYIDCLAGSANFRLFSDWFDSMFREAGEAPVSGFQQVNRPERLLAAVAHAVDQVLEPATQWRVLHWDLAEEQLLLRHPTRGDLPLSLLSDGVRNTVALVADVAHRCARLNPHFGEDTAQMTPGILLIDEVDLHLHPEWQQSIIEILAVAFPRLQLIVSTHSPQVLSTVDVSAIRIITLANGNAQFRTPQFQTKGVESADILAAIMGVDPVPKVREARWLSDYRALIEEGKEDGQQAIELKQRLQSHFGKEHPLMLECARLIRFSRFKRNRLGEEGKNAQT